MKLISLIRASVSRTMLGGLLLAIVITAIASGVYAVIQASLKWAHDIERSISKPRKGGKRYTARCATCGLDFLENTQVEDGKCLDCGRLLCGKCKAGIWLCPFCNRKREQEELPSSAPLNPEHGGGKISFRSFVSSLLKQKNTYGSIEMIFKKPQEDSRRYSNEIAFLSTNKGFFQRNNPLMNRDVNSKDSESGYKSSNSGLSDNESDNERDLVVESWEKNWLFKKKSSIEPCMQPVAMFVPRPTEESKARIGGVEVDDLSDFSDFSDSEIDGIIN